MDNAPAYTTMLVREFLAKNKTIIMPQPPYLPGLASAVIFLFPKLKTPMYGKHFDTIERIKKIEAVAVGDTKKRVSKVFRGLKQTLT